MDAMYKFPAFAGTPPRRVRDGDPHGRRLRHGGSVFGGNSLPRKYSPTRREYFVRNHRPAGARPCCETLDYEDCGSENCTPQYAGNVSRMVHTLAHGNKYFSTFRNTGYAYDMMNRLTAVDDSEIDRFDETFSYDAQGRMTSQRREGEASDTTGGEYAYYSGTDRLEKVSSGMGGTADDRHMGADSNFVYDADGNMTGDKSKKMTVTYDWRGLPTEFAKEDSDGDSTRLVINYDGAGTRISKRIEKKYAGDTDWTHVMTTHYTGLGSEIRENGLDGTARVVVSLPQGLGRYGVESASESVASSVPSFEYYLKNHLGSTMLVYGVGASNSVKAAYDYRAFGEEVDLTLPADKVTENFTGKERDDETNLSNHGARMLDPMLGIWTAVDPERFFSSPYLYMGKGYNPISSADTTGNNPVAEAGVRVALAVPSALYNTYQVQDKLAENGASRWEMYAKGALTFWGTLAVNFVVPNSDKPLTAGMLGAMTAGATNVVKQRLIEGKTEVGVNEVSEEAKNGFLVGSFSAIGKAAASKLLLEPTTTFVGDAVGTATGILLDQCEDK